MLISIINVDNVLSLELFLLKNHQKACPVVLTSHKLLSHFTSSFGRLPSGLSTMVVFFNSFLLCDLPLSGHLLLPLYLLVQDSQVSNLKNLIVLLCTNTAIQLHIT